MPQKCPVIYYVAGCSLYWASKALTIAKDKRSLFHQFADVHSIDEDSAKKYEPSDFSCWQTEAYFICIVHICGYSR
jgi:hypothetical protein